MNLLHEANDGSRTTPIPLPRRRGLIFPAFAWSGFSSAFASVIVGSRLRASLGTLDALFAATLGNWILFIYSAAIGFAAGRWGLSSQLVLEAVFGRWGAVIPGALLGVLVTGWFAFHVAVTATILAAALHLQGDPTFAICAIGVLFALPVIVRISHGFNMTAIAIAAAAWPQSERKQPEGDEPARLVAPRARGGHCCFSGKPCAARSDIDTLQVRRSGEAVTSETVSGKEHGTPRDSGQ